MQLMRVWFLAPKRNDDRASLLNDFLHYLVHSSRVPFNYSSIVTRLLTQKVVERFSARRSKNYTKRSVREWLFHRFYSPSPLFFSAVKNIRNKIIFHGISPCAVFPCALFLSRIFWPWPFPPPSSLHIATLSKQQIKIRNFKRLCSNFTVSWILLCISNSRWRSRKSETG